MKQLMNRSATLILVGVIIFLTASSPEQAEEWLLKDGKAQYQTVIIVPDHDAGLIYKQVNRWLVHRFENPEDILKARVEGEYLRGEVHCPKLCQLGALSSPDFSYTFSFEIKDERVRLTFYNGVVKFVNKEDGNRTYPIESYFMRQNKKHDRNSFKVISSVNEVTVSLKNSLEKFLTTEYVTVEDW